VNSEELTEDNLEETLCDVDGILVPGGFGDRGIEGKILAAKYAVKTKFRTLVSALECRWRLWSLQGM